MRHASQNELCFIDRYAWCKSIIKIYVFQVERASRLVILAVALWVLHRVFKSLNKRLNI